MQSNLLIRPVVRTILPTTHRAVRPAPERSAAALVAVVPKPPPFVPAEGLALVERAARSLHRRNARFVERDDVLQEAYEWAYRHTDEIEEFLRLEPDHCGARIYLALKSHIRGFVAEERAARFGHPEPDAAISAENLESDLLPSVFRREAWGTPAAGFNDAEWALALAECAEAYLRLDDTARDLVERKFRDGESDYEISAATGLSLAAVSDQIERAIIRIHDDLAAIEPDEPATIGNRRVMRNAAAIALTHNQDEWGS